MTDEDDEKKRLNRMREDKRKQISDAMTPSHPAGFPEGEEASNERGDEDEGEELINLKLHPPCSNPWWHYLGVSGGKKHSFLRSNGDSRIFFFLASHLHI